MTKDIARDGTLLTTKSSVSFSLPNSTDTTTRAAESGGEGGFFKGGGAIIGLSAVIALAGAGMLWASSRRRGRTRDDLGAKGVVPAVMVGRTEDEETTPLSGATYT
ncbi:hypothetical protein N8772_02765, partial [Rickettsiales bacterium]|nr:hypothetical protein [Rickettsiales bacterium]MDB2550814.1 hypothetical protein [Rickettsiales bacterium]